MLREHPTPDLFDAMASRHVAFLTTIFKIKNNCRMRRSSNQQRAEILKARKVLVRKKKALEKVAEQQAKWRALLMRKIRVAQKAIDEAYKEFNKSSAYSKRVMEAAWST